MQWETGVLPDCDSADDEQAQADLKKKLETVEPFVLGNIKALDLLPSWVKTWIIQDLTNCNSSTLREQLTLWLVNPLYVWNKKKLGKDGTNHVTGQGIEVKPNSVTPGKTVHGWRFNDATLAKLEEIKGYTVIVSSYTPVGQLIFIVEFPMMVLYNHYKRQVTESTDQHKLRSIVHFTWKQFDDKRLIVHRLMPDAKRYLSRDFYSMLSSRKMRQND